MIKALLKFFNSIFPPYYDYNDAIHKPPYKKGLDDVHSLKPKAVKKKSVKKKVKKTVTKKKIKK
jgi:hypothetical protein